MNPIVRQESFIVLYDVTHSRAKEAGHNSHLCDYKAEGETEQPAQTEAGISSSLDECGRGGTDLEGQ